jgi:hypothetical protein
VSAAPLPFRSADEITAGALDAALRAAGVVTSGRVSSVVTEPVGTGQMAESVRLTIGYDGPTDGPSTLIAKLPSRDERSRATGRALRAYEVEVGFYNDVASIVDVRTPKCHLAAIDLDTHDFVLLLEDLAPAHQGDQLAGCDADLAARVLDQAAAFHAPRWGHPSLEAIPWLDRSTPESAATTSAIVGSLYPGFVERFGHAFDDDILRELDRAMAQIDVWWQGAGGPRTVTHGDLRLDNLLIGDAPDDLWVVDWQTTLLSNGVADVSYFIGGNLTAEDRRTHEEALVQGYLGALRARGVEDLDWNECWRLYRHGVWHGVYLTVGASMLVEQTERGDLMFTTDLERHVRHAIDLEAQNVIGALGA